ncbi:aminotransferase class IV [Candidatus Haliotispira prima]|uniref:Aminotransferase class IV n=1 Tax=Candidatus Haliotispira prima TaxID=3034016 RepID=A0ABY8MKF5_9SPIO|nr:aminotransferase class IV [Candidatus Haliotispira prima]
MPKSDTIVPIVPFALETLPQHYLGLPAAIRNHFSAWQNLNRNAADSLTLALFHRRRLRHSCRLLGFSHPESEADILWRELETLRPRLLLRATDSTQFPIYSLRYFATAQNLATWRESQDHLPNSRMVAQGRHWLLLQRENPYSFTGELSRETLPSWATLPRVGLFPALRPSSGSIPEAEHPRQEICGSHEVHKIHKPHWPHSRFRPRSRSRSRPHSHWIAKCHRQVELAEQLSILKQEPNSVYRDCADLLCFGQHGGSVQGSVQEPSPKPLLLEGMKSNVFLVQNDIQNNILCLYTPRLRRGLAFHSGTTRNWLCHNAKRIPFLRIVQTDLYLEDLLKADGLLICNAAMGLRLVSELVLPKTCHSWLSSQSKTKPETVQQKQPDCDSCNDYDLVRQSYKPAPETLLLLEQLLAVYWKTDWL